MWAAWSPFASASVSESPSAAAASPSVAVTLASAPTAASASHPPQWRLLTTLSQRISTRWSRLPPPTTRQLVTAAAAVAAAAAAVAVVVSRTTPTGSGRSKGNDLGGASCDASHAPRDEGDNSAAASTSTAAEGDISFADPAVSAFNAYVHRIRRQKEATLLSAITQLETAAAELHVAQASSSAAAASPRDNNKDDDVAQLVARTHRCAVVADELLTQWICSLDGVPVRQRDDLKQRRKELVQGAAMLSQRIAPYLHLKAGAAVVSSPSDGGVTEAAESA